MIILSANKDHLNFLLSNPFAFYFFSLSSFIALARATKTMLNKNGESKHLCLFPDYRGMYSVSYHEA